MSTPGYKIRTICLYSLTLLAVFIQYFGGARFEAFIDPVEVIVGGHLFILLMAAAFDSWLLACVVISGPIGLLLALPFFPPLTSSVPHMANPYLEYSIRCSVTLISVVIGLALERRRK